MGTMGSAAGRGSDMAWTTRTRMGRTGHEWATGIAIEKLPDDMPAFVRDPAMLPELALMAASWIAQGRGRTARQGARSRPLIDLADDGKAMGIVPGALLVRQL